MEYRNPFARYSRRRSIRWVDSGRALVITAARPKSYARRRALSIGLAPKIAMAIAKRNERYRKNFDQAATDPLNRTPNAIALFSTIGRETAPRGSARDLDGIYLLRARE